MKEREVVNHEFVKMRTIGTAVAGRVTRYGNNDNGPFIVLEPIFVKERGGVWRKYGGAALGLTTDLRRKIDADDKGKILQIEFVDTQESRSGAPQKLFKVFDLDNSEASAIAKGATEETGKISDIAGGNDDDVPF